MQKTRDDLVKAIADIMGWKAVGFKARDLADALIEKGFVEVDDDPATASPSLSGEQQAQ